MTTRTRTARIESVELMGDFVLRLQFADGTVRDVDLEHELWGPMFEPLRSDPQRFREVRVDTELGTIVWPNGADMDPDVLYRESHPAA